MNKQINNIIKKKYFRLAVYIIIYSFALTVYESYSAETEYASPAEDKELQYNYENAIKNYTEKFNLTLKSEINKIKTVTTGNKDIPVKNLKSIKPEDSSYGSSTGDIILQVVIGVVIITGVVAIALSLIGNGL